MSDSSKKADAWMQADKTDLRGIFEKAKRLEEINRRLGKYMDNNTAALCHVANIVADRLVLIAANGSIATQIRFQANDLLRKFRQDDLLKNIQHVDCKVHPGVSMPVQRPQKHKGSKMQPLSQESARIMQEIAETIQDPKLKASMLRIASYKTGDSK